MKKTLSAVLTSALALVICVSMLIGTTFAWFTDSAASANNKIQAGTLDIELYEWTDASTANPLSESKAPVFTDEIIWEPGMTQTVYFSIKNKGNLDLKYRVSLDVTVNTPHALTDVMSYVITPDAKFGDLQAWPGNGTYVIPGHNATEATATPLYAIQNGVNEHFFALSIHMDESATNEYMGDAITFDIKVDAAQLASEPDGFNNPNYDADADYDGEISNVDSFIAALHTGGSYVLKNDIDVTEAAIIPEGKSVKLDLNGSNITADSSTYAIANLGELTIYDSSAPASTYSLRSNTVAAGTITARGIYNGYDGTNTVPTAKLTILGGNFHACGTNGGSAVFNYGTADIKGGTFTSEFGYNLNNQNGASMTVYDGVSVENGIYNTGATLIVNGGTINNTISGRHVIYSWNSDVTINDGDFYNYNAGNAAIFADGSSNVIINNGSFGIENGAATHGWTSCLLDNKGTSTMTLNNGDFDGTFRLQAGTLTINGGSFTKENGGDYSISGGTLNIVGGHFTAFNPTNYVDKNSTLTGSANNWTVIPPLTADDADSLAAAVASAKAGDKIIVENDITLAEGSSLSVASGVTLILEDDVKINGKINALGDLTLKGNASLAALSAINGGNITVELDAGYNTTDTPITETIEIDKPVTLVPNGMYLVSNAPSTFNVAEGGKLTITDGSYTVKNTAASGACILVDGGEFEMAGGSFDGHTAVRTVAGKSSTVTLSAGWSNRVTVGFDLKGDDTLNVTGGSLYTNSEAVKTAADTHVDINISGGVLSGNTTQYSAVVDINGTATVNMTGGTIESRYSSGYNGSPAIQAAAVPTEINISGDAKVTSKGYAIELGANSRTPVDLGDRFTLNVSGDANISATSAMGFGIRFAQDCCDVTVSGNATVNATYQAILMQYTGNGVAHLFSNSTLTIAENATVKSQAGSIGGGYAVVANGNVTITGGTISGSYAGLMATMAGSNIVIDNSVSGTPITINKIDVSGAALTVNGDPSLPDTFAYVDSQTAFETAVNDASKTSIYLADGAYKMPSSTVSKTVTISGTNNAVLDLTLGAYMENATVTFNGITIKTGTGMAGGSGSDYAAFYSTNATYKYCTFVGPMRVGRDGANFEYCTFTELGNDYVWTYGNDVTFKNCTFNTDGKAILIYADGGNEFSKVTVTNCTFNSTQGAKAGAIANQNCAAIEIDNYGCGVKLTANNNTYDDNFSGEWRIKSYYDNSNTVSVGKYTNTNGRVEYTCIALDDKLMDIDSNRNVTFK